MQTLAPYGGAPVPVCCPSGLLQRAVVAVVHTHTCSALAAVTGHRIVLLDSQLNPTRDMITCTSCKAQLSYTTRDHTWPRHTAAGPHHCLMLAHHPPPPPCATSSRRTQVTTSPSCRPRSFGEEAGVRARPRCSARSQSPASGTHTQHHRPVSSAGARSTVTHHVAVPGTECLTHLRALCNDTGRYTISLLQSSLHTRRQMQRLCIVLHDAGCLRCLRQAPGSTHQ